LSAPVLWVIIPAVATIPLFFFRNKSDLISLVQSGFCFLLAGLVILVKFEPAVRSNWFDVLLSPDLELLGRSLTLNEKYSSITGILYGFLGIWTLVKYFIGEKSLLAPLGLLFNALMLAALTVEPFLYAALIIEAAVIICVPILIETKEMPRAGLSRFLIFLTLGMPFILLAGWFLAGGEISPINDEQLLLATLLLGLGFIFWLAVFPFHTWMPLISENMKPIKGFYILIMLPVIIYLLLLKFLDGFVWLRDYALIYDSIRVFGLIMVVSGCIWAVFQTNLRKMISYLLIGSLGTMLLSASVNSNEGFINGAFLIFPRLAIFLLAAVSISLLEKKESPLTIFHLKSAYFHSPLVSLGLVFALISMTGMPLTSGFAPMLVLYRLLFEVSHIATILVMISMAWTTFFFLRIAYQIFLPSEFENQDTETMTEKILMAVLLGVIILAGIFPNPAFSLFANLIRGFDVLIR
jgi:formate hydrogenlyase subunit 3/multisubunit Na+/H+ antiporter MnhD subunit